MSILLGSYQSLLSRDPLYWAVRWGLVSHWSGNDLTDAYGGRTLTNNSSATFTAGKIGNAFTLASASSQFLHVASDSGLQGGNVDQWGSCWLKMASKPANLMDILSKEVSTSNNHERVVRWSNSSDRFSAAVGLPGTGTVASVVANTFGAPTIGVWHFLFWYFDSVAGQIGISIDGGAFDTATKTGNPGTNSQAFHIGRRGDNQFYWNGQLDEVSWAKNPPLGIATLATEIRDRLYNGDNGRTFPWN